MERQKNSESLFTSPKNITQVYPDDTQDERDTLKPKQNKNYLQLPTRKNNFFFQTMQNQSKQKNLQEQDPKEQEGQNINELQKNKDNQQTNIFAKQITIGGKVQNQNNVEKPINTKDNIVTTPINEIEKIPLSINQRMSIQIDKKDTPMHLDPLMIFPNSTHNGRNSVGNVSILSGEKTRRRISNFQKSMFQKKFKNENEFEGSPFELGDKTYEQNSCFPEKRNSQENFQQIPIVHPQLIGDNEMMESIIHKGRIFTNQRRATELNQNIQNLSQRKQSSQTKRKWNFVKKLGLVRKFIDKLQAQSSVYLFSRLTKTHINTINDKAYVQQDESHISLFSFGIKIATQYLKQKSWLQPFSQDSDILTYLNLFFLLAYTFLLYCIPLYVVFSFDNTFQQTLFGRIIPLSILFFDILVKCNTSYYKQGNTVTERRKIIKNYFKKHLFYDLLVIVGFSYPGQIIVHLVILVKLRDLFVIEEIIHQKFFISQNIQPTYTLIKLLYVDLFLAHMFSCGFIFVSKFDIGQRNWIIECELQSLSWTNQYVNSLYFRQF